MKRIFLDTETTGLKPEEGHRIVEIAAIAYEDNTPIPPEEGGFLHLYINPERESDAAALQIHKLTSEFLADQPVFASIGGQVVDFLQDAHLYIHNANFDVEFINAELKRLDLPDLQQTTNSINCTLAWSRKNNDIKSHNLDALCRHFGVDLQQRQNAHSAIVDTRLLAQLYFLMTRKQATMDLSQTKNKLTNYTAKTVKVKLASDAELSEHALYLQTMQDETNVKPLFK